MTVEVFDPTAWPLLYQILGSLAALGATSGGAWFGIRQVRNGNGGKVNGSIRISQGDYLAMMKESIRIQERQAVYLKSISHNTRYLVDREKKREVEEDILQRLDR